MIETTDGNQYIGQILDRNPESIRLATEQVGEINIRVDDIKKIELVRRELMVGKEYWFANPQSTRYFWSPNGYGLKKGEGYYQNVWILFNQFAYGITDNISLGAGFIPAFLFSGSPTPVWLTPKISIPVVRNKFNLGGGALLGTIIGEEGTDFGLSYGTTTFGSPGQECNPGSGLWALEWEIG